MAKKRTTQARKLAKIDRFGPIEKELQKSTKADLVALIMAIAREHNVFTRELEDRLAVERPVDLLVADVSAAIERATDFDERDMNRNFDVDWDAYAEVQKGLILLVEQGQLEEAKGLALKLMKDGSYQVECSDEGMMSDDIEECLKPVIRAVKAAGGNEAVLWARAMIAADRIGCLCDKELERLRGRH